MKSAPSKDQVEGGKRSRPVGAAIALAFLIAFVVLTKTTPVSWNDISRVAGIESLVERGRWAIDDSPWLDATADKVWLNGKFYSDKMPLFSVIGAGVYVVLYRMGGSLAPTCDANSKFCAYYWLTLILVGVPAAVMLWLFFDFALREVQLWAAVLGTIALGLGTMIFPYALVFNHHIPSAAALFAGFYILTRRTPGRWGLFAAGLLAALALVFDPLSGLLAASLFAMALVRQRARIVYFVIGGAIPILLTALLDYQIAQTIIPPYLIVNGYAYPGSQFPATIGGNGTPDDYGAYAFTMFVGAKGLFAFNPLLLVAFVGVVAVALQRHHPLRIEAICTAIGFVSLCLYLATMTGNYGGTAYGERWFVAAIPTLFAFIFFILPLDASTWKNFGWAYFVPLLALSVFSSWQGAHNPWQVWLPPFQLARGAQFPIFSFKWNVDFP